MASKREALEALKRTREGASRSKLWSEKQSKEDTDIYDVVTEQQFNAIRKGKILDSNFIEDDGVDGYHDHGEDVYDEREDEYSDDEPKKKIKKAPKKPKPAPKPRPAPSINAYRPVISAEKEDDFMANLLSSMDATSSMKPTVSRKRKQTPLDDEDFDHINYRSSANIPSSEPDYGNSPGHDLSSDDIPYPSPAKKPKRSSGDLTPTIDRVKQLGVEDDYYDDSFDANFGDDIMMEDIKPVKLEEIKPIIPPPKASKFELKPKVEEDVVPAWLTAHAALSANVTAPADSLGTVAANGSSVSASTKAQALEEDGSLRMFWLDYLEADGGKVHFIGKVLDKNTGRFVSCCTTVEGIERNVYILPREQTLESSDGEEYETDHVPTKQEVWSDFEQFRKKARIQSWAAKWVKRNYAFGEKNVPSGESEWMKVVYGFNEAQIPPDFTSPNIARVFGTNTSAFELLVLKRKIMGPCWLSIKHPVINTQSSVSWCKLEVTVNNPKDINPFSDADPSAPRDIPPLTVMSLAVRTIVNHQANKREVVCVTARTWENLNLQDSKPPETLPFSVVTFVRPLDGFPKGFEAKAKSEKQKIVPVANERALLNNVLITMQRIDPDVVVGHEFLGESLDVFLHRMREEKADHFSRIGRFRRKAWPNIGRQGTNIKFMQGRLVCDLASDAAKSMIESTSWSLAEMVDSHLKQPRQDIDPADTASFFDSSLSTPHRLLFFVHHCEMDAHFQMALVLKVQMLQLTRQLTELAGNSWNKTLNGGRAERNEYILLHEFHRLKFICPDKSWGKKAKAAASEKEQRDGELPAVGAAKKQKYKGGLVFEPKKGLWDKFILVMDFNSLYPSIIQEFNIDFTTIERDDDDEDKIPEVPSAKALGVLPRLIATLVARRKEVKKLMASEKLETKRTQYDIKQKALKLTANSMYGCLGFENSRFHARPLAALTTFKGREILSHTRELAESLNLDASNSIVVYGDTDSVFINSGATDLAGALKVADDFKRQVNERYRLLEIDTDSVFQRLLLLQKKKYAALKVTGPGTTITEVKGLDMKRREYSILSKTVSGKILEHILSGENTETVVENIHDYLTTVGQDVRNGKYPVDEFIIHKRLSKDPEQYPDAKTQPHVQVALKMKARSATAKSGDVIPYVFCIVEEGDSGSGKMTQAERARHPDDVRKSGIKIDFEHYLSHQILPPIERLCEPIQFAGTDRSRLAECLGLDPRKYQSSSSGGGEGGETVFIGAFNSQMSDKERFKDCSRFAVTCPKCQAEVMLGTIGDSSELPVITPAGPVCPTCQTSWSPASVQIQLELQIRKHIARYYEGYTVCDDPTCGSKTRMMGVYGRRCLRSGCRGTVKFEYSDAALYTQLLYYASLFDQEKPLSAAKGTSRQDQVTTLVHGNIAFLDRMSRTVEKHLEKCGRRYVELGSLFSFMKI